MKKIIAILLTLVLALSCFVGCSGSSDDELTPIVVGASATPHAEVLEQVKDTLAEQGYDLQIIIYDDYILPNQGITDGTLDANYFQHTPYLNSYNASNGTDIVSAGLIHYEPFGLYGNGVSAVSEIAAGATIIIPADDSNETRALFLLQQEGLITLADDSTAEAGVTTLDITDDGGYNIIAVQADTVPSQLSNSDAGTVAVINGNYALQAGLSISDALAVEDASGEAAQTYANIIACANGNETSEKILALVAALQTEEIAEYMETTYNGAVQPMF
ncbi:MAG: MetQ/NlpA family ABC transporter substrate-binding protein [Firmicutes bacterium]|nr:MetQ/NlpA family ABC transporter substrate-binding protein [Bacillota bacterium]